MSLDATLHEKCYNEGKVVKCRDLISSMFAQCTTEKFNLEIKIIRALTRFEMILFSFLSTFVNDSALSIPVLLNTNSVLLQKIQILKMCQDVTM